MTANESISSIVKKTTISSILYNELRNAIVATMADYYGLEYTDDGKLIFVYTPIGSRSDYATVISDDQDEINIAQRKFSFELED